MATGTVTVDLKKLYAVLAEGIKHDDSLLMPLDLMDAVIEQQQERIAELERQVAAAEQVVKAAQAYESLNLSPFDDSENANCLWCGAVAHRGHTNDCRYVRAQLEIETVLAAAQMAGLTKEE